MATVKGIWAFNAALTVPDWSAQSNRQDVSYTLPFVGSDISGTIVGMQHQPNLNQMAVRYTNNDLTSEQTYIFYNFGSGWSDTAGGGLETHTIDFGETEQEVTDAFYSWLTANATQSGAEPSTVILPAGTYRFNDVLSVPSASLEQDLNFTSSINYQGTLIESGHSVIYVYNTWDNYSSWLEVNYRTISLNPNPGLNLPIGMYVYTTSSYSAHIGWGVEVADWDTRCQTITLPTDQEVSAEFYEWFFLNAYMISAPGKDGVTIKWDGNTDGLEGFPYSETLNFYRVSDRHFTVDDLSIVAYRPSNESTFWHSYNPIDPIGARLLTDGVYQIKDSFVVVDANALDLPVGVYFSLDSDSGVYSAELILANAEEVVEESYTVSGKWKFHDVLTMPSTDLEQEIEFITDLNIYGNSVTAFCNKIMLNKDNGVDAFYTCHSTNPDYGLTENTSFWVYVGVDVSEPYWKIGDFGESIQTLDFGTSPQTVSKKFYTWFVANAEPVSEEPGEPETTPAATIRYNGSVIASLNGGQTATLKCEGMRMESDVVVKVEGQGSADKAAQFFAENFPSDVWGDGEYTGSIMSVPVTMRYKYRLDRDDPKDIPFVGMIESDDADFEATENLADWYLKTAMLQCGRIQATYESGMSQIIYLNPVVPTYYDLSQLFSAQLGMEVKAMLNATQCGVRNYEGVTNIGANDTVVNFSAETDLDPEPLVGLPLIALLWQVPIQLEWHHEVAWAYGGQGGLGYSEWHHVITENGHYEWVPWTNGYTGVRSVTVDVPIPDGYVQPSGTKVITENGTHNVSGYENAEVNVQGSASQNTSEYASVNCPVNIATEVSVSGMSDAEINRNVAIAASVSVSHEIYYLYFLYNGVRLPRIPDSVLKNYPYAWIRNNTQTGYYDLLMATGVWFCISGGTNLNHNDSNAVKWYRVEIATAENATEWSANTDTTSSNWGNDDTRILMWSNHDIPNGSATATDIYFEGTEPVPTD